MKAFSAWAEAKMDGGSSVKPKSLRPYVRKGFTSRLHARGGKVVGIDRDAAFTVTRKRNCLLLDCGGGLKATGLPAPKLAYQMLAPS